MDNSQAPDPDSILKTLETELAMRRAQRQPHAGARTAFRIGSLLILIVGLLGALVVLQSILSEMKPPGDPPAAPVPAPLSTP